MENKKLNERESLELISNTIERARKSEIGRLNFITLYGVLGLVVYTVTLILPDDGYKMLWMFVPAVSYLVPFFYHKMWQTPTTVTGRVVKSCWSWMAFLGTLTPFCCILNVNMTSSFMVIVLSGAVFMLCGIYKHKTILWCGIVGMFSALFNIGFNDEVNYAYIFWHYVFFAYSVYIGLMIDRTDDIREPFKF